MPTHSQRVTVKKHHVKRSLAAGVMVAAGLAAAAVPAANAFAAPVRSQAPAHTAAAPSYSFRTVDDQKDPTFNQLLGINDFGRIAGYFGSGASAAHPNRGFTVAAPYSQGRFRNENFPGAAQTQVVAINDSGTTAGFYVDPQGDNFGWVLKQGVWKVVIDPHTTGNVNQVLGINNEGKAVGFYTTGAANTPHAFEFNFHADTYSAIRIPGATSSTATGINNFGAISGFYTNKAGATLGFVLYRGHLTSFSGPGSTNTMAFGINNFFKVVGSYTVGNATHGFVRSNGKLTTVDDPNGVGTTIINGLNNHGQLVGFYTTDNGNITDGFVARLK